MNAAAASEPHALGHTEIDADHRAFLQLIAELSRADDAAFVQGMRRLVEHTRAHFERENALMQSSGFPALKEHQGEHNRVLGELTQFQQRAERGLLPFARAYVLETAVPWFGLHIQTMDSALVAHLGASAT